MQATQSQGPEPDPVGGKGPVRPLGEAEQRSGGQGGGESSGGARGERHPKVGVEPALRDARQLQDRRPADDRKPGLPGEPSGIRT